MLGKYICIQGGQKVSTLGLPHGSSQNSFLQFPQCSLRTFDTLDYVTE